ncbi:glycosyltransferase family 2 protein [Panacibacter ginsenosidivorans]|uniref:Glycosyltransferase family 2 protein n=1 Tax=Panacibacter ginsenosidivorans TaxID=1813871 RepID=A0A5B8V6W3_9BACT|nr:glycosyltransferase [Panacibacter ginsenosidivorans]QEC66633.1 glycosyltransferase family 2 protein [Panacibacter ginsenosidivorans]
MKEKNHFKDVTLLVTHYNRSRSLERLLQSFKNIECSFGDIVVSDDGSKPEHLNYISQLHNNFEFRSITTPVNKGLGNNINKGQDAIRTAYTLYVQEDFEPAADFAIHFQHALDIADERKDIDLVRFYAYFKFPYLKPFRDGFSEMKFKWWLPGYKKFYYYSDHPHLRRSNFFEKFGRYPEGVKGDVTEYRMMMSFLKNKGKAMFYEDYKSLFFQKNSAEEPSTMKRNLWRESNNIFIHLMREAYRHFKFNYDLLLR